MRAHGLTLLVLLAGAAFFYAVTASVRLIPAPFWETFSLWCTFTSLALCVYLFVYDCIIKTILKEKS